MTSEARVDLATDSTPQSLGSLDTPAVIVEVPRMIANLDQMASLSASRGVALRPHAKSHKSRALVRAQLDRGAMGITVAKLDEAEVLSGGLGADGWCDDVFLAYPLTSSVKANRALRLAQRVGLRLTVDTVSGAEIIEVAAREAGIQVGVMVEIDSGLARCGIQAEQAEDFARAIAQFSHLDVLGPFSHAGHVYGATSPEAVNDVARHEVASVQEAAAGLRRAGVNVRVVSVGSTPTVLTNVDGLADVDEIRPGNYLFKDRMQVALGVARLEECALSVLATVVSTASGNAVIDAGSKTLGLDRGAHGNSSLAGFGLDVESGAVVDRLSEEHGIITDGAKRFRPGDRVRLVPNHACVVTDHAAMMYAVNGEQVVGRYDVDVRGGGH